MQPSAGVDIYQDIPLWSYSRSLPQNHRDVIEMESLSPGVNPSTITFEPNPNGGPPDFSYSSSLLPAVIGVLFVLIL